MVHAWALSSTPATDLPRRFPSRFPSRHAVRAHGQMRPHRLRQTEDNETGARKNCVRNLVDLSPLVLAGLLTTALSAQAGSRVIVSTTLDSTLEIFDADSLGELRSSVPSRGGGAVRLWVQE